MTVRLPTMIALLALACWSGAALAADERLAKDARAFLTKYCHDCHGGANDVGEDLNVVDRASLLKAPEAAKKAAYIVPGKPGDSLLWDYMGVGPNPRMPKKGAPQPTPDERKIIERWIVDGAEFPKKSERKPIDAKTTLTAIRDHLNRLKTADRPYQRFFTLDHLHNNQPLADEVLAVHRAAVSKLANSLSWQPEIVIPEEVPGTEGTLLVIDLRKLGWEFDDWKAIARAYPYSVTHSDDEPFRDLEREVARLAGTRLAAIRADWFVATVSRPPLYDRLLKLPASLKDLEHKLGVNLEANFDRDILKRAGMITSGVSKHNRLVERHPTPFGAYWRSYDFGSSDGKGNLNLFPLGPRFLGNHFDDQAFEQAGGEVIFHLPNGLQGYMLADAKDRRLDAPAPIAIVRDREETAGTPEVVNGISCIACHKNGMKTFQDEIRNHPAVFADARAKMLRLYPPTAEMDKLLARDEKRFLDALDQAIGPFLKLGDDSTKSARDLIEPVGEVARLYNQDLTPEAVAAELELPSIEAVRSAIGQEKFNELGLGPLLDAKAVKRELWEGKPNRSLFQRVSNELNRASQPL
jgi:mono/diheme cytochrome c family protein